MPIRPENIPQLQVSPPAFPPPPMTREDALRVLAEHIRKAQNWTDLHPEEILHLRIAQLYHWPPHVIRELTDVDLVVWLHDDWRSLLEKTENGDGEHLLLAYRQAVSTIPKWSIPNSNNLEENDGDEGFAVEFGAAYDSLTRSESLAPK